MVELAIPTKEEESQNERLIKAILQAVIKNPDDINPYVDGLEIIKALFKEDRKMGMRYNKIFREMYGAILQGKKYDIVIFKKKIYELYKASLFLDAPYLFDAYMQYIEWERDPGKRFYMPRKKQLKIVVDALQMLEDDELDLVTISLPPGVGKAQPLYSKVLTLTGFVNMGSVSVGDKVVSGRGNISTITSIHPQGMKSVYRVKFDDGTSADCCEDHLWTVQTRDDRRRHTNKYRTIPLRDIMKNVMVEGGKRKNYSVDYVPQIDLTSNALLIDPYLLGIILGDGCLCGDSVSICNPEAEIIDYVRATIHEDDCMSVKRDITYTIRKKDKLERIDQGYRSKTHIHAALDEYGLMGTHINSKFIPKDYLYSSFENRLELLRGILDTDGYANKTSIEYVTVSEQLCNDVLELVRSLGARATYTTKVGSYVKNGERHVCQLAYRISIVFDSSINPFKLSRKANACNFKREVNKKFIASVEYVGEYECQCIVIDDPSHLYITDNYIITHNSQCGIFFLTWLMGKYPDKPNLVSAHSGMLTRSFYDGILQIINDPEYLWHDVFPAATIAATNSKEETIDIGRPHRFSTFTGRSIDGSLTGATRCEKLLYGDDLCSGLEEAMSKERMDKLWAKYTTDLKSRKKDGCKELHIATRWTIHDPIGHLMNMYEDNPRAKFIAIPALNEKGESNFDYLHRVGFDTAYFEDMKRNLDPVSFAALYQNEPVERDGLLYQEHELKRYEKLPTDENDITLKPDAIIAICDTKDRGQDYAFLPVAYVYGSSYYIEDCVCDNGLPSAVDARLIAILLDQKVKACRFESNSAGGKIAEKVQKEVKERGGITHITTQFTTANKETKIIVNSQWVKEHCIFKFKKQITANSDYDRMMRFLCSYTVAGKNKHDDVPDGMAMLAEYAQSFMAGQSKTFPRPF